MYSSDKDTILTAIYNFRVENENDKNKIQKENFEYKLSTSMISINYFNLHVWAMNQAWIWREVVVS